MPIYSVFTSTCSPKHLQTLSRDLLKMLRWQRCVSHTVTWFSVIHTWASRKGVGVGLISFCLLKCVQMDVLVMVALETSRIYRAWPEQSLSCCQSREEARQVQMLSLKSERFFCSAHSRNSSMEGQHQEPSILSRARKCSTKLLPARVWPSQEEPCLSPGRGEVGLH